MELTTVKSLIEHLQKFDENATLIVDVEGNTFHLSAEDIVKWDEDNDDSPVAITTHFWFEK